MSLDANTTRTIVDELQALIGARVQRVDVVDVREIVIELRRTGRTFHLLLSARPGMGRIHLVDRRPTRVVPGGSLQSTLRKRLVGRGLATLESQGAGVIFVVPGTRLVVFFSDRPDAISIESADEVHVPSNNAENPEHFPSNEALLAELGPLAEHDLDTRVRRTLLQPLDARIKKCRRLLRGLEEDRARLLTMTAQRRSAEMLKPVLHQLRRGDREAEIVDWESGEPVRVALDPRLSPVANLERMFAQAKKGDRGLPVVDKRVSDTRARLAQLEAERQHIEQAPLEALRAPSAASSGEPQKPKTTRRQKNKPVERPPIDQWSRRFETEEGFEIRVGRGSKENDRLTFSIAKGHDLWLHARGVPGAHVLVRLPKGQAVRQEALLDAAHLAVHFSDAKNEAKAEVIYVEARYVRKIKGAPPGQVSLSKEKTMLLVLEPSRLARLLGRQS